MATKKDSAARSVASGRFVEIKGTARAKSTAIATLRESRSAEIASALKQASRKTGLFSKK